MSATAPPTQRSPWPWAIAAGMGVVFAVNGFMFYLANTHRPILEAEDYYERGLEHDRVIEAERASARLGWRADVAVVDGGVRYTVSDRDGQRVTGLVGALAMTRADTRAYDREGPFVEVGPGVYRAVRGDGHGLFRLRAHLAGAAGTSWVDARHFEIP